MTDGCGCQTCVAAYAGLVRNGLAVAHTVDGGRWALVFPREGGGAAVMYTADTREQVLDHLAGLAAFTEAQQGLEVALRRILDDKEEGR